MFVFMQTLAAIERQFVDNLLCLYAVDEIKQFCYLLAENRFGWSRATYLLNRQASVPTQDAEWFTAALLSLQQAKPIQYILGHAWFMDMELTVNEGVLI